MEPMPAAERSPSHPADPPRAARPPEPRALAAAARARDGAHLDPDAWRIACRFHRLARGLVLRWLREDGTGRLAQLARACPGALVLAAGLEARGGAFAEAGRELRGDVQRGLPLDLAVDVASGRMVGALVARAGSGAGEEIPSMGAIESSVGAGAVEPWLLRVRWLVRRAGPRVSPLDLCALPPPVVTLEDVPASAANARWYAAMRVVCDEWLGHEVPRAAWSFASRHGVALAGHVALAAEGLGGARAAGAALARRALLRGLATGRWPCRSADARRWLEALEREPEGGARLPLYDGPVPRVRGVVLRPLGTAGELVSEGRRMRNCLGQWYGRLVGRRRWVFTGLILGEPVDVEVWLVGARYVVPMARGPVNGGLTDAQRAALVRWLRALNRRGPPAAASRAVW